MKSKIFCVADFEEEVMADCATACEAKTKFKVEMSESSHQCLA